MLTRRAFLLTSVTAAVLVTAGPAARAQGAAAEATNFIVSVGNQLAAIVNGPGSAEQKKAAMRPIIERAVAISEIGQFVLGRFWRVASPEQQQRFLQLFHSVVLNNVGGKLGEFSGVSFRPTTTTYRDGEYYVGTTISRPNQQPNNVQWVVSMASGRPQIIDVIAEGTSLRLTQRSDYASYLSRNGNNVEALLTALQRQVAA